MSTETKTPTVIVSRDPSATNPTATSDATKTYTDGCGKTLIVDARLCGQSVTVTVSTKGDPLYNRTTDDASVNPFAVTAGSVYASNWPAEGYGQGGTLRDLTLGLSVSGYLGNVSGLTPTPSDTGGSLTAAHGAYYYRVAARNKQGTTIPCAEQSASISSGSSGSIALAWTEVTGAIAYDVYGRETGAETLLYTVLTNAWTDTGALVETTGAIPGANTAACQVSDVYTDCIG